jgi:hypothetical protein
MKKQEHKLILDLYKHYKSVDEISNDEIDLLYDKYGNIRNILKNLIQEFEPNTIVSEYYLDEKLNKYGINKEDNSNIKSDIRKDFSTNDKLEDKSNNKSFKKNILIAIIGVVLVSIIIWLLIDKRKNEINIQNNTEIVDTTSIEDEEVVNTSLQNSKYGNESYEEENIENSTNLDNSTEINSSETPSLENYKAVVVIAKTYFYETPSYEKKRKAFLVEGDSVDITNEENGFLYVSFTNSNGKTTIGWIAKGDVEYNEIPK